MEIRTAGKSLNSTFFSHLHPLHGSDFSLRKHFRKQMKKCTWEFIICWKKYRMKIFWKWGKNLCRCHFVFEWSPRLNWYSVDRSNVNFGRDFKISEHLFWQCQSVFWTGNTFVSFRGSDRVLYAKCLSRETSISLGSCLEMLRDANCLADLDEQGAQRDSLVTPIHGKQKVTPNWI